MYRVLMLSALRSSGVFKVRDRNAAFWTVVASLTLDINLVRQKQVNASLLLF